MASADNAATPAPAEDHNDLFNAFQTSVHLVEESNVFNHVFTVLGASGDLAKKKIYPTLWALFRDKLVPDQTYFVGYARSSIDMRKFLTDTCYKFMKVREGEEPLFAEFVARNYYLAGSYDKPESFQALNADASPRSTPASASATASSTWPCRPASTPASPSSSPTTARPPPREYPAPAPSPCPFTDQK